MFVFWGTGSDEAKQKVAEAFKHVRDTGNFNWTFIFILAVVFYVYWSEIHNKNWEAVRAGLALYAVNWLYEICNAIIGIISGYPLWTVSGDSTTFILLIGVSWELSMMFSLAGIISYNDDLLLAVSAGSLINGLAGDIAKSKNSDITMVSSDTVNNIKEAIEEIIKLR